MKTYIVGNWKLNFTVGESSIYLHKLLRALPNYRNIDVIVAPSTIALQPLSLQVDRHKIKLAAQNGFYRDYGAFTGETSFTQLRGIVDYVIIGHSERRYIFGEDEKFLQKRWLQLFGIRSRRFSVLARQSQKGLLGRRRM